MATIWSNGKLFSYLEINKETTEQTSRSREKNHHEPPFFHLRKNNVNEELNCYEAMKLSTAQIAFCKAEASSITCLNTLQRTGFVHICDHC